MIQINIKDEVEDISHELINLYFTQADPSGGCTLKQNYDNYDYCLLSLLCQTNSANPYIIYYLSIKEFNMILSCQEEVGGRDVLVKLKPSNVSHLNFKINDKMQLIDSVYKQNTQAIGDEVINISLQMTFIKLKKK